MPLSKVKQAKWMRQYRVKNKILGITTNITRGIADSVIPKPLKGTPWIEDIAEFVDSASEFDSKPEIDADGNSIPEY